MHFSTKSGRRSSVGPEILAFVSHCSPNFKLKHQDSENIKTDCVVTVVFNLLQIKHWTFSTYFKSNIGRFLGTPGTFFFGESLHEMYCNVSSKDTWQEILLHKFGKNENNFQCGYTCRVSSFSCMQFSFRIHYIHKSVYFLFAFITSINQFIFFSHTLHP